MRILIVEDDIAVATGLLEVLQRAGYSVDHLPRAEPAESVAGMTHYDLAIVDIGLPGMDGYELIRRWRRRRLAIPVLILNAREGVRDRVMGLDIGADDYVLKPFEVPELLARIRALIRRSGSATSSELVAGKVRIDLSRRIAEVNDQALDLTSREWDILQQLVIASPKALSKQKMAESLSRWDNELTSNAVEIYVSRLRTKLRNCGIEIHTIRGLGYRLQEIQAA
jgi:two-component system, OmpR family, response regulator